MSGTDLIVTFANQPGSITVRNYASGALNISLIDAPEPAQAQGWLTGDKVGGNPDDWIPALSDDIDPPPNFVDTGVGKDVIIGTASDNYLIGGPNDSSDSEDAIQGGGGNDIIEGGGGNDVLAGGSGCDRFVLIVSACLREKYENSYRT